MEWLGGPVLHGRVPLYYIFYGSWTATRKSLLGDLAASIGNSPWLEIVSTYSDGSGAATADVVFGGSVTDNYSSGTSLNDTELTAVVSRALLAGSLPASGTAVYFVVTSADVSVTFDNMQFCSGFCGFHGFFARGGLDILYAFVGNPDACPSACTAFRSGPTPNGDLAIDGMATGIAHELAEVITNPLGNAWTDLHGRECADVCV